MSLISATLSKFLRTGFGTRTTMSVDQFVGARLSRIRTHCSVSPILLAELLEVRTRDIDLFEQGRKRIPASRLFILAEYFDIPVAAFFDRRIDAA